MDLLKAYDSDGFCSKESENDILESQEEELDSRTVRQVYLITYSRADQGRFPTRESFVQAVLFSFNCTPAKVVQWCCCLERHAVTGIHYHIAIKLNKNQRWLQSKRSLLENFGISVHFSAIHANYYSAWQYVTKEDSGFIQSVGHPDLTNDHPPRTTLASATNHSRRRKKRSLALNEEDTLCDNDEADLESVDKNERFQNSEKRKKKRMSSYELSEIVVAKRIKTRTELLALAREQKLEGKTDIAEFIINRGSKVVAEILESAWEMEDAQKTLERQRKSRLQLLQEARLGECVENCNGDWLVCAREVLERNGVEESYFAEQVYELLDKGRGKYRNIMIVGVANCGKTFLLDPLNVIYETFSNPASTSFAWVGAEKAEILFLNDFRWTPSVIQWHDFLLLLEGQLVHLPAPKSHYAKDIAFTVDTPIFATGKNPIVFVKNGALDEKETEMMNVRWKIFRFHAQIPQEKQKQLLPCGKCFATLILGQRGDEHL